jgi:hypothetical protein
VPSQHLNSLEPHLSDLHNHLKNNLQNHLSLYDNLRY